MAEQLDVRCEACGRPMVERTSHETGAVYLGCTGFPDCVETRPLPEYLRLRRMGATPLPGLES